MSKPLARSICVADVEFACPRHLLRLSKGWQIRPPKQPSRYFGDEKYGSTCAAFSAAEQALKACLPTAPTRVFRSVEGTHKHRLTGTPGVYLCGSTRPGRTPEFRLHVRVPGHPIRVIYVGTDVTFERNYPRKLQQAVALRQTLLQHDPRSTSPHTPD